MTRIEELAGELLGMVRQPIAPRGEEISRERWEIKVKAQLAQVFNLGMGVGWDKAVAVMRENRVDD
jgi:hypothetical protein